jgi:hypothetical protein
MRKKIFFEAESLFFCSKIFVSEIPQMPTVLQGIIAGCFRNFCRNHPAFLPTVILRFRKIFFIDNKFSQLRCLNRKEDAANQLCHL